MALNNWKTMLGESNIIFNSFSDFFKLCYHNKKIKKIRSAHDGIWYNEYLKIGKKLKTFLIESCGADNTVVVSPSQIELDCDMLELYLSEIYISHDVRYEKEKNNTYVIYLTYQYMAS